MQKERSCHQKNCECTSFEKGEGQVRDKTEKLLTEDVAKYGPFVDCLKVDINCKSACLFNESGKCMANGITLNDLKEKPFCMTQIKK